MNSCYNGTYAKSGNYAYDDAVGAVRNADRKCKAKTNLVSACGKPNLSEYTAMHVASGVFAGCLCLGISADFFKYAAKTASTRELRKS